MRTKAIVIEDDFGITRCGECGAEILCDDRGDMPDNCLDCGRALDYSIYEPKEET